MQFKKLFFIALILIIVFSGCTQPKPHVTADNGGGSGNKNNNIEVPAIVYKEGSQLTYSFSEIGTNHEKREGSASVSITKLDEKVGTIIFNVTDHIDYYDKDGKLKTNSTADQSIASNEISFYPGLKNSVPGAVSQFIWESLPATLEVIMGAQNAGAVDYLRVQYRDEYTDSSSAPIISVIKKLGKKEYAGIQCTEMSEVTTFSNGHSENFDVCYNETLGLTLYYNQSSSSDSGKATVELKEFKK